MQNQIFESVIRTSGADTDDIHSGEAESNFWAPNPFFEAILKEAVEEASIEEEKDAHERHFSKKGFEWYYFGSSVEEINENLEKYKAYFNKKTQDEYGNSIQYGSYKITDEKTKETIGWLNYILSSQSISNIKIKHEMPNSENDCLQQMIKHLLDLFQNNSISSISWEAYNDLSNKRIKQYASMCQRFGGTFIEDKNRVKFSLSQDSLIKNKDAILKYFKLT